MNTLRVPLDTLLARSGVVFTETMLSKVVASLPSLSPSGPWLAGGSLRRTLLGEEPTSDFDLFFASQEQMDGVAHALEGQGAKLVADTEHHKTYLLTVDGKARPVQLIRFKFYTDAAAVADSFDYTICQFVYDGLTLTAGELSLWDLARKRLVVHRITFPVSSVRRLLKYQKQGYYACGGALTALLLETVNNSELHGQLQTLEYVD